MMLNRNIGWFLRGEVEAGTQFRIPHSAFRILHSAFWSSRLMELFQLFINHFSGFEVSSCHSGQFRSSFWPDENCSERHWVAEPSCSETAPRTSPLERAPSVTITVCWLNQMEKTINFLAPISNPGPLNPTELNRIAADQIDRSNVTRCIVSRS